MVLGFPSSPLWRHSVNFLIWEQADDFKVHHSIPKHWDPLHPFQIGSISHFKDPEHQRSGPS